MNIDRVRTYIKRFLSVVPSSDSFWLEGGNSDVSPKNLNLHYLFSLADYNLRQK